jgi:predicted nucleic acid-binding protein
MPTSRRCARIRPVPAQGRDDPRRYIDLPVIQEVLQGFREERAYRTARDAMTALPIVESQMEESLFMEAAGLYRAARRQGLTIRSSVDCLIAACALRHDMPVFHKDRDYDLLGRISPLVVKSI